MDFVNPGIEEVDYQNIISVISKTATFIQESYQVEDSSLNVFDKSRVESFISEVSLGFISTYSALLPVNRSSKEYKKW